MSGARTWTSRPGAKVGFTVRAPGTVTIWRLLVRIDGPALDAVVCVWIRACLERISAAARARATPGRPVRRVLAVDCRAMRATNPAHLIAAVDHAAGVVVARVSMDVKTNEIPMFAVLLDQIPDLEERLITAGALHAEVAHLKYLYRRGSRLLVCVKDNQPALRKALKGQPWTDILVGHTESGRGHGRIEKRTLKAATVEAGLGFPHATQAIQFARRSRPITPGTGKRAKWRTETVYAITTLTAAQAHPDKLARWLRGHWGIEVRLHGVRDVNLGEDLHQARTGSGRHALDICRNLMISLLRLAEHTNIARARARARARIRNPSSTTTRERNDPASLHERTNPPTRASLMNRRDFFPGRTRRATLPAVATTNSSAIGPGDAEAQSHRNSDCPAYLSDIGPTGSARLRWELPTIIDIPVIRDDRGAVGVVERDIPFPFDIKRVYYLFDVPSNAVRGSHAHKSLSQLIIAISGSFSVGLHDGTSKSEFLLSSPDKGLTVPPGYWRTLDDFSAGSAALVFASAEYDPGDYIRDFAEFQTWATS